MTNHIIIRTPYTASCAKMQISDIGYKDLCLDSMNLCNRA